MSNLSRTSALYLPPAVSLIQDAYVRRSEVDIHPLLVVQVGFWIVTLFVDLLLIWEISCCPIRLCVQ